MSHNLIKYFVLLISLAGSVLAYLIFQSRTLEICDIYCGPSFGEYHNVFLFFPFLLLFSLITHFTPERVFQSWWKFTRVAAPVVLILAFIINLELHHSPAGEFQNMFDAPALWAMYIIFSFGSAIQIIRGYRQI